ncbi:MAG: DoxX family protein [Balneolaceae bacterium]
MQLTDQITAESTMVETRHYWIEFLRIFLGGLLFYKGFYFVENISVVYEMIEQNMQIPAFVLAHYVVAVHLVGGLMLMFGVLTRIATAIQIPVLVGAVFFVHGREAFLGEGTNLEFALLVLVLLVVYFFYGAGKWSVDHWIIRRKEK